MKTLKLIKTASVICLIALYVNYIGPEWVILFKTWEIPDNLFIWLTMVGSAFWIFFYIFFPLVYFFCGGYNDFFAKHTDPIITKIQSWFNRRNEFKEPEPEQNESEETPQQSRPPKPHPKPNLFCIYQDRF